jgi:hypothetical protein
MTSGKAQITFTIALDDIDSRSRASLEDNESASESLVGSVYENQINLASQNGLRVLVYNLDGTYVGEVTDKEVRKVSENEYSFNGQLTIENFTSTTLPCRLMVYANCLENNETFDYDVQYIPMWGVKQTTLRLTKGELTKLTEPIYLLRSMAKVEVKLADAIANDFELTSVVVDKYNKIGNVLPSYQKLVDTEYMDPELVFNPNTSIAKDSLSFMQVEGEDAFYVYLPEYDNVNPATLSVVIDKKTYTIEFKNYVDGKASGNTYNIVRNHIYQYTITSVTTESDVEIANLKYQSMPWNDVNNGNLNFGNGSGDVKN